MGVVSAIVMGFSYYIAGILPMVRYFASGDITEALYASIEIACVVLSVWVLQNFLMSVGKIQSWLPEALQAVVMGSVVFAATSTHGLASLVMLDRIDDETLWVSV